METNALVIRQNTALTIRRDADVYRLAALVLSTLDRIDVTRHEISRIRVIGQRVVIFDLPYFVYDLTSHQRLGVILTHLIVPQVIAVRPAATGSLLIIDLAVATTPHRTRSSMVWCSACGQLMAHDHTHQA